MARSNGDAEEILRDDFDKLKADVAALTKDIKTLVQERGDSAMARGRAAADDAIARGKAAVEDIGDSLSSAGRAVTRQVVDRPVPSLAVSFLAGLLLGQILRR